MIIILAIYEEQFFFPSSEQIYDTGQDLKAKLKT
jgi:hypothetical protein